jgi:hypothetical protein
MCRAGCDSIGLDWRIQINGEANTGASKIFLKVMKAYCCWCRSAAPRRGEIDDSSIIHSFDYRYSMMIRLIDSFIHSNQSIIGLCWKKKQTTSSRNLCAGGLGGRARQRKNNFWPAGLIYMSCMYLLP